MISRVLIIFFSLIYSSFLSQQETKIWSESEKLKMNDFKVRSYNGQKKNILAATISRINFEVKDSNNTAIIYVRAVFHANESGINKDYISNKFGFRSDDYDKFVLSHEQAHFDITELVCRKFRKEIHELNKRKKCERKIIRKIYKLNDKYYLELNRLQQQFDFETDHGHIFEKHEEWLMKIDNELRSLEEYKKIEIVISFRKKRAFTSWQ